MAAPLSGGEGWCALYRAWSEGRRYGGGYYATDHDDVRVAGPEFGWNMTSEPLLQVTVPLVIAHEGAINGRSFLRLGDKTIAEMTRAEARQWLKNPGWRSLNQELAKELLDEEKAE
jgi:hypothetical protein